MIVEGKTFFLRLLGTKIIVGCLVIAMSSQTSLSYADGSDETMEALFNLSFEELLNTKVETATKTPQELKLSPAVITVVTAKDIVHSGYQNVAEILSHVVGFVDNDDLSQHNFGVRGINSGVRSGSRTLKVMINSQPVSFRSTSQNFLGNELIPMDLVDRVEIVRGPVSALYGANAFLGVVNIITKKSDFFQKEGGAVKTTVESYQHQSGGYQAELSGGGFTTKLDYIYGVSQGSFDRSGVQLPRNSPSYDAIRSDPDRSVQAVSDDSKPFSAYAQLGWDIDTQQKIEFNGHFQRLDVENPFSELNPLSVFGTTREAIDNYFLRVNYHYSFSETYQLRLFAAYADGQNNKNDKQEVGAENFFLKPDIGYHSEDFGAELFISLRQNDTLLLGLDSKNDHQRLESFTRVDRNTGQRNTITEPQSINISNKGFYLQYLWQLNSNWRVNLGYRMDDDSIIGQQESVRFGVVGNLPHEMVLKLLFGSSFQAPSPELLFRKSVQSGDIIGNPELNAQKAQTTELSLSMPIADKLNMTTTLFHTEVNDLVTFQSDGSNLLANNLSASKTNGLELELRMLFGSLDAYMNYSYQKNALEQNPLSLFVLEHRERGELFPKQTANLGFYYHWEPLKLSWSWNNRWVDSRPASTSNVLLTNQFYSLGSYMKSDMTFSTTHFSLVKGKQGTLS